MVVIREMQPSDCRAVSVLLTACYRYLAEIEHFTPEQVSFLLAQRASEEAVRVDAKCMVCRVAEDDARPVGIVVLSSNEITRLFVDPACHRLGIGTRLFREAERLLRASGYTDATLGAFESAVPFYQAMGMVVTGWMSHRSPMFGGCRVAAMRKDLAPGTLGESV